MEVEAGLAAKLSRRDLVWLLERLAPRPEAEYVRIAKDPALSGRVGEILTRLPTIHRFAAGDARSLPLPDGSAHLILTSPPYWNIVGYPEAPGQIGNLEDYGEFLAALGEAIREAARILAPGGRLVVVVGDVVLARRRAGRHRALPLHADVIRLAMEARLDYAAPIIWEKVARRGRREGPGPGFLGKPYQPNQAVKTDAEYVLVFRKPGYRRVSRVRAKLSVIPEPEARRILTQVWRIPGARPGHHPAPFPLELARRIVRLYSYADDLVVDPFCGSGTTPVAAALLGRNSLCLDVVPQYVEHAYRRLLGEARGRPVVAVLEGV